MSKADRVLWFVFAVAFVAGYCLGAFGHKPRAGTPFQLSCTEPSSTELLMIDVQPSGRQWTVRVTCTVEEVK